MNISNFVIEKDIKFVTNNGDFNEQPVFTLLDNKSLSGNDFINVSRIRTTTDDGGTGALVLFVGTTGGFYSSTGIHGVYAQSITSNGVTSDVRSYTITTFSNKSERVDIIINDLGTYYSNISVSGIDGYPDNMFYYGCGIRPDPETLPVDGTTGKSLSLYYTYNRQELGSGLTFIADRSGNSLTGHIKGASSGDGTSSTVTGYTYSPLEGGFRFNGKGWIESASSSLFNPVGGANSGMTVMMFAKLSQTGNSVLFDCGSGTTSNIKLYNLNGVYHYGDSNGTVESGVSAELGKWSHLTVVFDGSVSSSNSGIWFYVNGRSASNSAGYIDYNTVSNGRLMLGKDMDLVSSGLTGAIGLTRVWNRALSANEVFKNYISTIPSQMRINEIKIG